MPTTQQLQRKTSTELDEQKIGRISQPTMSGTEMQSSGEGGHAGNGVFLHGRSGWTTLTAAGQRATGSSDFRGPDCIRLGVVPQLPGTGQGKEGAGG